MTRRSSTCLSCSIAFPNPEDQRTHYRSDLHRYNMKRRVANLPPVKADVSTPRFLERRAALAQEAQTATVPDRCEACDKKFASQNAYRDHLNSKKHKENVVKLERCRVESLARQQRRRRRWARVWSRYPRLPRSQIDHLHHPANDASAPALTRTTTDAAIVAEEKKQNARDTLMLPADATEEQIQAAIDAKVASSRRIDPAHECIFCPKTGFSNSRTPSHTCPRRTDSSSPTQSTLSICLGWWATSRIRSASAIICLYCNGRGKGFHNLESVRNHMLDKFHCRLRMLMRRTSWSG